MEEVVTIGLDIAKSVFQVHGVNSMGEADRNWASEVRIRDAFTAADKSRVDLSGHRQYSRDPDFAWSHQDREHGPLSRC